MFCHDTDNFSAKYDHSPAWQEKRGGAGGKNRHTYGNTLTLTVYLYRECYLTGVPAVKCMYARLK